jgi:ribosomal protein S12 methylthiotransferase accessory factor
MRQIGVTRIADSTGLDTMGIPVFSAIRPDDAGIDGISVYNGKGLTKAESLAGAMMEAVERFCGEVWPQVVAHGTFSALKSTVPSRVFDPNSMRLQIRSSESWEDIDLDWVHGWDLIENEEILIPLNFVVCPFLGPGKGIWSSHSHGLASGNTIEEAVCHALAELIERDAYTLAMVRAQLAPRARHFVQGLFGQPTQSSDPDRSPFPLISLDRLPRPLRNLATKVSKDGSRLWLRSITSDTGIPSFVASIQKLSAFDRELVAGGFGCHPDAIVAAIRAITEAAQGRIVQIQGVREDATRAFHYSPTERILWCCSDGVYIDFDEIGTSENDDILIDIDVMLNRLKRIGIKSIVAVDLSVADLPARVVRLVAPDLECWFLNDFAADKCNLGPRAQKCLFHPD